MTEPQLSRADLETMSAAAIMAADKAGQLTSIRQGHDQAARAAATEAARAAVELAAARRAPAVHTHYEQENAK